MPRIVSVQDISCLGQCSLTVALPVLSAYGIECSILPSGILSTHTLFPGFTFLDLTEEMERIVSHWRKASLAFDAVYTGYIGDSRQFGLIKGMKDMLAPGGRLYVDPAMADNGRLYPALDMSIVEGMRGLAAEADLILPNLTEACFLLDTPYREDLSLDGFRDIAGRLADLGPKTVILTGVSCGNGKIGAIAFDRPTGQFTEYFAEKQAKSYHGTGDIFSSVVVANLLNGSSMQETLRDSCEFIVDSIRETADDDSHGYGVKFERVLAKRR